jgi:hypothetical protein
MNAQIGAAERYERHAVVPKRDLGLPVPPPCASSAANTSDQNYFFVCAPSTAAAA